MRVEELKTEEALSLVPAKSWDLIAGTLEFAGSVTAITIGTDKENQWAVELARQVAGKGKELDTDRLEITRPLDARKKAIMDLYDRAKVPLKNLEDQLRRAVGEYATKREQERLAEQLRREEEARKERERIEALARAQRYKEEQARREAEEAARRAQEAEDAAERAKLQAEADKLNRQADAAAQRAESRELIAAQVVAPIVEAQAVDGLSTRKEISIAITDKAALVRHLLESGQLYIIKQIDEAEIKRIIAKSGDLHRFPGVAASERKVAVLRGMRAAA